MLTKNNNAVVQDDYSPDKIKAAKANLTEFISTCSDEVFRTFLPSISEEYSVVQPEFKGEIADSVAYFEIARFVENEKEQMIDCLKSVYHVLANSRSSVALVIRRKKKDCIIGLSVGNPSRSSEKTIKDAERLKDAFIGNFPGSICGDVATNSDNDSALFSGLSSGYCKNHNNSIAVVSNIATEFTKDYATQGIEKLLDGIRPVKDESEYTLVILGEALTEKKLETAKEDLYRNYQLLSPYATEQKNMSLSEMERANWNLNLIVYSKSMNSDNSGRGESYEITNYKVKHTLDVIEKQMERLEESAALGLWNFAAYIVSPDLALTNEVAHMFMSLTQGKESFAETSAINVWNGLDKNKSAEIEKILLYLRHLRHPLFEKTDSKDKSTKKKVTATTIISGAELARSLSLPQKSVPGFPVYSCARFGRNINAQNEYDGASLEVGKIYHMRQVEDTPVSLNKKSLTSHVFITGSTGAGKSNTVFQLIKRAKLPFLVIEPAKGEYKNVFGGYEDVIIYGTNPKITKLLRINPFSFPAEISVSEHIDRLVELFNVCWPMYAAMPAILKDAVIKSYEAAGWDIETSENAYDSTLFPTFVDVLEQIRFVLNSSDYSSDNKSDYTGALVTRLRSLTNGINGQIFSADAVADDELFDRKVIVDLSRVGSTETRAMIMGLLVMKLQEYRLSCGEPDNSDLKHITVLEEAHNILKRTSTEQSSESSNLIGKSVEMLTNAIAELRSFGEGFIIADQAPGLLDMAVIRNTNTKIIHRLPDQSDRELAGRAAGLNDEQINELAKLERGVAAIYQNNWIEPVLCMVDEFKKDEKKPYEVPATGDFSNSNKDARKMMTDVLLNRRGFVKVDLSLILRSNLSAKLKTLILRISRGEGEHILEDQYAKAFYLLYPELNLDFQKDGDGRYIENIKSYIVEVCGELTPVQMKIASIYLLTVASGFSKIKEDAYTEIKKELSAHD